MCQYANDTMNIYKSLNINTYHFFSYSITHY
jgi:hypothetical protein